MKRLVFLLTAGIAGMTALAQNPNGTGTGNAGTVIVPGSSVESPSDVGRKAHTNHLILVRTSGRQSYLTGLSPANIGTAYQLTNLGGAGIIAIVDAYHYGGASDDLSTFSSRFSLASLSDCPGGQPGSNCFLQVYANSDGTYRTTNPPPANCGWNQEAALDIEWAHAMAPNATIVLVEANSNSFTDLFGAVKAAALIVGGSNTPSVISMSWGGSEFAGETSYDVNFQGSPNVLFIASSGDTGGQTIYPSASPYVIAAGGTTLNMTGTAASATFQTETAWSGSGGGPSKYEYRPGYQDGIAGIVGAQRGVPDFSFDADPSTGVLVYGPTCSGSATGWMIFGGTSVSAPALAGILNSAAAVKNGLGPAAGTTAELQRLYGLATGQYRDIVSGRASRYKAAPGWDFVTGVGTPITLVGK